MKKYTEMTKEELMQEKTALEAEYEKIKNSTVSLMRSKRRAWHWICPVVNRHQISLTFP